MKNYISKLAIVGVAVSAMTIGANVTSTATAHADGTNTISNLKSVTKQTYVRKSATGWTYNIDTSSQTFNWGGRTHYLKNYPNTTWYVTKSMKVTTAKNTTGTFYYVTNGKNTVSGWVWSGYLKAKETTQTSTQSFDSVYTTAKKYLGTRYIYGGTTPAGFDCSGYTQYVYKKSIKKNLARTAQAQYNSTSKVSSSNVQKGDLVYFGYSKRSISHVGIYIGNGNMIDSQNNGVVIEKVNAPWWNKVGYSRPANLS
ncbi:C40 family peptidase [Lentilactobacillus senioris]|uniref:C40 family peptidase n=1 Tax=Lentilactobacillus senioris TaxID=931534 RepID=UPI0022816766|nr:C40 family peptidase [Lentilactobacillus senioris]MCY9807422.1 C40 family peptidase [Lentilactobacillus senioris]